MKLERSDIKFPLWRKKVDTSLFTKLDTPIPKWLADVWTLKEVFENNRYKNENSDVVIKLENKSYKGWIINAKYQSKDTDYKLLFTKELAEKLKDLFIMSYMRTLENKLRKEHKLRNNDDKYKNNIEDEIPFWEFLDIEFDKQSKTFICKAHYVHRPLFPELFKQFIRSHLLRQLENKLLGKGDFKFIKEDWQPKSEIKNLLDRSNIIYYLIDTTNKLIYIGESEGTKRIRQTRKEIPGWDYFRIDCLPEWLSKEQRLELERLIIRSFASILYNCKGVKSMAITNYTLANKKIDV